MLKDIEKQAWVLLDICSLSFCLPVSPVSPRKTLVSAPAVVRLRLFLSSTNMKSTQFLLGFFCSLIFYTWHIKAEFDNKVHVAG